MTTAGLTNLAASVGQTGWGQMNAEVVVDEDPEWIVYPDRTAEPPSADSLEETTAITEGNVVAVDDNAMSQPGPNVVYAIETIIEQVYPEVYAEIEAELEASGEPGNGSGNDTDEDQSDDSAIPGFGVPVALVALLATAGFVARRR
jgi:iron complex transport system substrate-binding protein